jgi:hypothetical protein
LFSLPHLGEVNSIEIGFRGEQGAVAAALAELVSCLQQRGLLFEPLNDSGGVQRASRAAF